MSQPEIESYRFGKMVVDGETYTNDLILLPDRVISGWWRENGHSLSTSDLDAVLAAEPDVLVIGTGAAGMMAVPKETEKRLLEAGIQVRVATSGEAWGAYNELRERHEVAAAFHLTC